MHKLWADSYGYDLPDSPLNLTQIADLILRTGWDFSWKEFRTSAQQSAYQIVKKEFLNNPDAGVLRAAAYTQPGGIGHCVVAGGIDWMNINRSEFTCYQRDTYGEDVLQHVEAAETILVIYLKCPSDSLQWVTWRDRAFWNMLERRKSEDWQERKLKIINDALDVLGLEKIEKGMIYRTAKDFTVDIDPRDLVGIGGAFDDWKSAYHVLSEKVPEGV